MFDDQTQEQGSWRPYKRCCVRAAQLHAWDTEDFAAIRRVLLFEGYREDIVEFVLDHWRPHVPGMSDAFKQAETTEDFDRIVGDCVSVRKLEACS